IAGAAVVDASLRLEAGAEVHWLPQETLLFNGARLVRRIAIDMAADARLLVTEAVVFGRTARGESVLEGVWSDHWRSRRGGRLVFADATILKGPIAEILARPTTLASARAFATIVHIDPAPTGSLGALRAALAAAPAEAAASERDGVVVSRIVAADGAALRSSLIAALLALRSERPMPRVWMC